MKMRTAGHISGIALIYCGIFSKGGKKMTDGDMLDKGELRRRLRKRRAELSSGEAGDRRSSVAQRRLLESVFWQKSRRVVLYAAVKGEVDTALLLESAWKEGREVFLPRCRPEEPGLMDMIACCGPEELVPSRFGIPEPELSASSRFLSSRELEDGEHTLIVVPALAFDRQGFRLGYGGGYYDRMLDAARCFSVGLTYHELLQNHLPREAWDRPVGAVCTEEELLCL